MPMPASSSMIIVLVETGVLASLTALVYHRYDRIFPRLVV